MRFAAALVVFGYHLEGFFYFLAPYAVMNHVFTQGTTGVSFFFVLSGFVLTWSHRDGDRAGSFYRRRAARIGPLHVVTWAVMGVLLVALATRPASVPALASLLLLSPWTPGWALHLTMNNPAWSLGCEAFFYALFPLLLVVLRRLSPTQRRVVLVTLVAAVLLVAVVLSPTSESSARFWLLYFFPPTRLLEFAVGMLLAAEVADGRLPRLALGPVTVLALGAYVADSWAPVAYQQVAVTLVPFMALLVAGAQADTSGTRSGWRWRPVVRLGVWSFALYLVHWPVMTVLAHVVTRPVGVVGGVVLGVGALAASVVAAAGLHRWVEAPLERVLRGGSRRRPRTMVAVAPAAVRPAATEPTAPTATGRRPRR